MCFLIFFFFRWIFVTVESDSAPKTDFLNQNCLFSLYFNNVVSRRFFWGITIKSLTFFVILGGDPFISFIYIDILFLGGEVGKKIKGFFIYRMKLYLKSIKLDYQILFESCVLGSFFKCLNQEKKKNKKKKKKKWIRITKQTQKTKIMCSIQGKQLFSKIGISLLHGSCGESVWSHGEYIRSRGEFVCSHNGTQCLGYQKHVWFYIPDHLYQKKTSS